MPSLNHPTGKAYWRSLDEIAQTPEFRAFVENEFPNHTTDLLDASTRRQFLKIMGASFALAGLTGCRRWPEEKLAPFAYRPEGRAPGTTLQYATAMELGGISTGLLVSSYDGRPIKIEGNPLHPASLGAASAQAQAGVLELYDPDRSRYPVERPDPTNRPEAITRTWDEFLAFARPHFEGHKKHGGTGLAVLSEASSSPTLEALRAAWTRSFPNAAWYEYEAVSRDSEREGIRRAFGKPLRPHLHLEKASLIVCLGADILGSHPDAVRHAHAWAAGRKGGGGQDGQMNRLVVAESTYTVTGSVADHRTPMPCSRIGRVAAEIAQGLAGQESAGHIELTRELQKHKGKSLVIAGPEQPPAVHEQVARINAELGNIGTTITYTPEPGPDRPSHEAAIQGLVADMRAGKVQSLLILGGNPVYNAPADLGFADALARVATTIRLGHYEDETSTRCRWHLPRAHFLEAWGDARAWDGTAGVVQPLIEPLYGGKSTIELMAALLGDATAAGYELVRRTWADMLPRDRFEAAWRKVLHDGVLDGSAFKPVEVKPQAAAPAEAAPGPGGLEVTFLADRKLHDGRFANNGWLQELPDSLTQITWDNAALISIADAKRLGFTTNDVVTLSVDGRQMEIAVYVMPGQAEGSIALPLGYGRTAAGRVGNDVGFNTYALRTTRAMHVAGQASLARTGKQYRLACAQDHHAIDRLGFEERRQRASELIREIPLPVLQQNPRAVQEMGEKPQLLQLWDHPAKFEDHRWGMAIDLTSCIGCNACVVACQAENNIPIVGKEEVIVGREMHWIRIDRYFSGEPEDANPGVAFQPMTCHHCENAPCESVCPVSATVHDTEGLNTMVYNRCIGTRYCSNNCPYKVRRFNYFDYHSKGPKGARLPYLGIPDQQQLTEIDQIRRMGFNPDVTVRMRGVMEKCTFCVQRIQGAKIRASNEKRPLRDGEIVPACAQTCPTQAIVFGDLNDANSRVRALQEHNRSYFILDQLNVRPRLKYLARINNPGTAI